MENNNNEPRPSQKRKRSTSASSFCFTCCFRKRNTSNSSNDVVVSEPRLTRTSSTWLKAKISDLPELRGRYRHIVSKLGNTTQRNRRRHASDFSYDAFSYALNFDDDLRRDDEFPHRSFSARVPSMKETYEDEVDIGFASQPIGEVNAFKFPISD